MAGVEDRMAKIKAIQEQAAQKKLLETERIQVENSEAQTSKESERSAVETEIINTIKEISKTESALTEVKAIDLSELDTDSQVAIQSEIDGIYADAEALKLKLVELQDRKSIAEVAPESVTEMAVETPTEAGGESNVESPILKPLDLWSFGKMEYCVPLHNEKGNRHRFNYVEINGLVYIDSGSYEHQFNGTEAKYKFHYAQRENGDVVKTGCELNTGNEMVVQKNLFDEKGNCTGQEEYVDGKIKQKVIMERDETGRVIKKKFINFLDDGITNEATHTLVNDNAFSSENTTFKKGVEINHNYPGVYETSKKVDLKNHLKLFQASVPITMPNSPLGLHKQGRLEESFYYEYGGEPWKKSNIEDMKALLTS